MHETDDIDSEDTMTTVHQMNASIITSAGASRVSAGGSAELGRRLLLAARHGNTALVLDLMGQGAPFTTDWLGTSALHLAASGAHTDTCAVLLRAGVSRDCRTKVERTPLHMAAHAGHAEVAELLLQHHAIVDCRDMLLMTPLHWAAERAHAPVARVLLQHGADPHAVSKFHKTPISIATERKHRDILRLIDEALEAREAAKSVESLQRANESQRAAESVRLSAADPPEPESKPRETSQKSKAAKLSAPAHQPESIKLNIQRPLDNTAESDSAAAMLRRHGITLLPQDEGSTVLSALQSGRSVVLSDAGKLMLKESSEIPHAVKGAGAGGGGAGGVVLSATPVQAAAARGTKVFTLNKRRAPLRKIIYPDTKTFVKLSAEGAAVGRAPPPAARPTLKLTTQNIDRKLDDENELDRCGGAGPGSVVVPAAYLTSSSAGYLRGQLLAAHRTIARLRRQLEELRAPPDAFST